MKKRALIMKPIIAIVVLAISLVVIYFAITSLNAESNLSKEACKTSVIARATFNAGPIEAGKEYINLNCRTEKICVTESGESCEISGFQPSKENPITKKEIKGDTTRQVVLDVISDSLYDCNEILGEGKINFLPSKNFDQNYCLVCARIALDEEARSSLSEPITYLELYRYMQQKPANTNDGQSYLEFVYGVKNVNEMALVLDEITNNLQATGTDIDKKDFTIDLSAEGGTAVIAQMAPPGKLLRNAGLLGVLGGGIVATGAAALITITAPISIPALTTIGIAGAGVTVAGAGALGADAIFESDTALTDAEKIRTTLDEAGETRLASGPALYSELADETIYARPTLYNYDLKTLQSLGCTSFEFAA